MSAFTDKIESRRGTLAGAALGVVLFAAFAGQSYREIDRFKVNPADPSYRTCLGLTKEECVARVATNTATPLNAERVPTANEIGDRQRARRTTTTRSTSSPPSNSTPKSSGPSTSASPQPPSSTPSTPPSGRRSPGPNSPSRPTPRPSTPTTPTAPSSPSNPPHTSTTPTGSSETPSLPSSGPALPPVQTEPPPVNVPVPPVPIQVCTPFAGVNCPPGSVQAQRTTNRGPGNSVDPVEPGRPADNYDVDPNTPSNNVNAAPKSDGEGEG